MIVEDEMDRFNITDAKSLLIKMEQGKLAKSTNNLTEIDDEQVKKPDFRNKVKKMQIDNITSKVLASAAEDRFNRIKKEKMLSLM